MTLDPALIDVLVRNGIDPRDVDPTSLREDRDRYRALLSEGSDNPEPKSLKVGSVYIFHMSAAAAYLDEDNHEVIAEFLGLDHIGRSTFLIVRGEETGEVTTLNVFYTCGFDLVGDDEDESEETDDDGVRILREEGE